MIGRRWKRSNVCSLTILIGRQLDLVDPRPRRNDERSRQKSSYAVVRVQRRPIKKFTLCGGYGLGVPPVPIPNTEVKPQHADGTWLETARESRSLPHPSSPLV